MQQFEIRMRMIGCSEDGGGGGLIVAYKLVEVAIFRQLQAFHIFTQLSRYFLLFVTNVVAQVAHLALQVVRIVETQDFSHPQNQEIVVKTLLGNANYFGSIGEVAPFGLMQFSPDLDCLDDLSDSALAFLDLFVALLHVLLVLLAGALLVALVDHLVDCLFFFDFALLFQLFGSVLMKVESLIEVLDLFEAAVAVVEICILLVLHVVVLVLRENVGGFFGGGVGLDDDLVLVECLEDDFAVGEWLDDGAELGQVEFFVFYDQALGGQVDKDLAECHFSVLLKLRNVDVEGAGHLVLVYDDEFATNLFPASRIVPKFVIVNTHYNYYMLAFSQTHRKSTICAFLFPSTSTQAGTSGCLKRQFKQLYFLLCANAEWMYGGSQVFLLVVDSAVVGTIFSLHGRRTDGSVAATRAHNVLLIDKFSPVCHAFFPASLPFLFSEHPELLDDLFCLELFHFAVVGGLLQLDDVVLLVFEIFENIEAGFLVLFLEGGVGEGQLAVFGPALVLLLALELSAFFGLVHDAQVDLPLVGVAKCLVSLLHCMPGIFGPRVFAFVGVQHHREGLVLLLDLVLSGSGIQLQHVIGVVEFLVSEALYLYVCFEGLGLDGLVLDGVDFAGVVCNLLPNLLLLLHSLLIIYNH